MRIMLVTTLLLSLTGSPVVAQVNLNLPTEPRHVVDLPRRGPQSGAALFSPPGPGPHPAIVLSHTCAGLLEHVFEWAARAIEAGYVALIIDHLGPRSVKSNCPHNNSVSVTEYAKDAVAGMKHLRSLPFVDGGRIAHMGFSYGAMAGLRAARAAFRSKHLDSERFNAIIAMYPWCNQHEGRGGDHQTNFFDDTDVPLLLILGEDDDEASPYSCIQQAKKNAERGLPATYKVYPKTTHAFDRSFMKDKPFEQRLGNRTVIYRYNESTVRESWRESVAFFALHLGPKKIQ